MANPVFTQASIIINNMVQTWNAVGTTFTAIKMNVTDTASAAASKLIDLQLAGVSKFALYKTGNLSVGYTTDPGYTLGVNGNVFLATGVLDLGASGHRVNYTDANLTISNGTTGAIIFTTGGERLRVTNAGNLGVGTANQFGSGVKVIGIVDATTVPTTNPTGGGVLYSEGGALKWRGSSGTVTIIAAA